MARQYSDNGQRYKYKSIVQSYVLLCAVLLPAVLSACGGPSATPVPIMSEPTLVPTTIPTTAPTAEPTFDLQEATPTEGEVVVFAATSLKDAFGALANVVKAHGIAKTTFNFAGSQTLAAQLSQGAQADVFASADERNMATAVTSGVIEKGSQRVLVSNSLVIIVPSNGTSKVNTPADLAAPGLKLVLADPSVPAGAYSLQVLDKFSADPTYGKEFKDKVLANVVSRENNVRQVSAKVQLGEADAGIVYRTDVNAPSEAGAVAAVTIPDAFNVIARYYIAPLKQAPHPEAAKRFINYTLSADGQRILTSFGFRHPNPDANANVGK